MKPLETKKRSVKGKPSPPARRGHSAKRGKAQRRVISARDAAQMDGKAVNMNAFFSNGVKLPPAHPNCRCAVAFEEEAENLTPGADGGILGMQGDGLVRITNESIKRIPIIESSVLPEEHWETLRQESMSLLESMRGEVLGTERIIAFDLSMSRLGEATGLPGDNRVLIENFSTPHILVHNHADSGPVSIEDFESSIKRPNSLAVSAIGHDGSVSILEKLPNYDASSAVHRYISAIESVGKALDDGANHHDISRIVERFLDSLSDIGFSYWRWQ